MKNIITVFILILSITSIAYAQEIYYDPFGYEAGRSIRLDKDKLIFLGYGQFTHIDSIKDGNIKYKLDKGTNLEAGYTQYLSDLLGFAFTLSMMDTESKTVKNIHTPGDKGYYKVRSTGFGAAFAIRYPVLSFIDIYNNTGVNFFNNSIQYKYSSASFDAKVNTVIGGNIDIGARIYTSKFFIGTSAGFVLNNQEINFAKNNNTVNFGGFIFKMNVGVAF